ncbi:hypothetical protein V6N11_022761 [Hibiscus sabdariffa]|uniref:Uncharacterized protein n=1 Tax=Hibiscus sabdariffa TaxID=183260 RepID=A0ABR2TKI0_9ROSI
MELVEQCIASIALCKATTREVYWEQAHPYMGKFLSKYFFFSRFILELRLCECRIRLTPGRSSVRLGWPPLGRSNPSRLHCQDCNDAHGGDVCFQCEEGFENGRDEFTELFGYGRGSGDVFGNNTYEILSVFGSGYVEEAVDSFILLSDDRDFMINEGNILYGSLERRECWCPEVDKWMADSGRQYWSGSKSGEIRGHEVDSCGIKLEGEVGPYQFGDWLRVPLARKRPVPQGYKKPGIVYTNKEMGGVESYVSKGKVVMDRNEQIRKQGGRGQAVLISNTKIR